MRRCTGRGGRGADRTGCQRRPTTRSCWQPTRTALRQAWILCSRPPPAPRGLRAVPGRLWRPRSAAFASRRRGGSRARRSRGSARLGASASCRWERRSARPLTQRIGASVFHARPSPVARSTVIAFRGRTRTRAPASAARLSSSARCHSPGTQGQTGSASRGTCREGGRSRLVSTRSRSSRRTPAAVPCRGACRSRSSASGRLDACSEQADNGRTFLDEVFRWLGGSRVGVRGPLARDAGADGTVSDAFGRVGRVTCWYG